MCNRRYRPRERPLSAYDLIPNLDYGARDWVPEELPELVKACLWCGGKGQYEQTYTIGCGNGSYRSMGRCDHCSGVGLLYFNGGPVPISVLNQIVVARQRKETAPCLP